MIACRNVLIALLILAPSAFAAAHDELVARLKLEMTAVTSASTRPLTFFHWGRLAAEGLPVSGNILPKSAENISFFKTHLNYFWDNSAPQKGAMGNGMYFATDPASTQLFASPHSGAPWLLVEVEVRPGMKILDLRAAPNLSQHTQELLGVLGCPGIIKIQMLFSPSNSACRKFLNEALSEMNVDAINFSYLNSPMAEFGLHENPGALVLIGKDLPDRSAVTLLTKSTDQLAEKRSLIKAFITQTERFRSGAIVDPWPSLQAATETETAQWAKSSFFGYGGFAEEFPNKSPICRGLLK